MKVFIWSSVNNLTDNYHGGGGLMVFAESLEEARGLISNRCPKECSAGSIDPDISAEVSSSEIDMNKYQILLFPDAGCC